MQIIGDMLYHDDGKPYPYRESPNKGDELVPEYLVIHYTAGPNAEHSLKWLTNPQAKASAHLLIARDGSITQLVPFNEVAWHAGKSQWRNISGLNNYSIGIELDNAGPLQKAGDTWVAWFGQRYPNNEVIEAVHKQQKTSQGWHLYTAEQMTAVLEVSALLVQHYGLKEVLGHDDIAPGRKTDPGPAFPMDSFKARVFGRIQEETPHLYQSTTNINIRSGPGSEFAILKGSPLPTGTRLEYLQEKGSWIQFNVIDEVNGIMDLEGWIHSRYVKQILV
jgi:N-acetylmuramoyl-L-alanine amidase